MPFINSKVTVSMTEEQKETIKTRLGKAISLVPGKSEHWLMIGFEDNYTLYFQGNKSEASAFVEVKIYGKASPSVYDDLTSEISMILNEELGIPENRIYVQYTEVDNWGWNGGNF